ncbi:MAG: hypothetical protein ACRDFW_02355 [bacterium]
MPNKFFEEGGRVADVLGQEWEPAWGSAGNLGPWSMARDRRFKLAKCIIVAVFVVLGVVLASVVALFLGLGNENAIARRFMLKPDDIIVEQRPDPAYDQLFPYYVELCTTSQWNSKAKGPGGVTGHAGMYIKGACKDRDASFPQLRRCRYAATEFDDPEHGAGVSVNRWLRNVNWLAIPGYKLFYEGNVETGQRLTQAHLDATVRDAIDAGVFDGVELHDYPTKADAGRDRRLFERQES